MDLWTRKPGYAFMSANCQKYYRWFIMKYIYTLGRMLTLQHFPQSDTFRNRNDYTLTTAQQELCPTIP